MSLGYAEKIRGRIEKAEEGTIFINSDFSDIAKAEIVRRNLNRLASDGIIRRVLNGLFEKPRYSEKLKEYVVTDPEAVAMALARRYRWTIAPCGNTALNHLGLSTQVPAVWSYISDGPYKTYEWGKTKIVFKSRTNREISRMSYMTVLLVQGLKTLGKENINENTIDYLSKRLSDEEKADALKEALEVTDWIYEIIKRL
jgi:hypothetical protein